MRLYVDLDLLSLIFDPSFKSELSSLTFKRGDTTSIEVQFIRDGLVQEMAAGMVLSFAVKERGDYDATTFLVYTAAFVKSGAGSDTVYLANPDFNSSELTALLNEDIATLQCMGEFSWTIGGNITSSQTIDINIENDVNKGNEGSPAPATPTHYTKQETDGLLANKSDDDHGHDAAEITSGVLDIARLPATALPTYVAVADEAARFALTTAEVQKGDVVKQLDTDILYYVIDDANLANTNGYTPFSAVMEWAAILNKPATFPPDPHTHSDYLAKTDVLDEDDFISDDPANPASQQSIKAFVENRNLDASKLTGTIDADRLPKTALPDYVAVADEAARFALTTAEVQKGDVVKQLDTDILYYVIDDANLANTNGYTPFSAVMEWSAILNKPSTYPPDPHAHSEYVEKASVKNSVNGASPSETDPVTEKAVADHVAAATIAAGNHSHPNKPTIDKFSESGGQLLFDGSAIGGGGWTVEAAAAKTLEVNKGYLFIHSSEADATLPAAPAINEMVGISAKGNGVNVLSGANNHGIDDSQGGAAGTVQGYVPRGSVVFLVYEGAETWKSFVVKGYFLDAVVAVPATSLWAHCHADEVYDAVDGGGSKVTTESSVVSWKDLSGSGNHFNQPTAGNRGSRVNNAIDVLPGVTLADGHFYDGGSIDHYTAYIVLKQADQNTSDLNFFLIKPVPNSDGFFAENYTHAFKSGADLGASEYSTLGRFPYQKWNLVGANHADHASAEFLLNGRVGGFRCYSDDGAQTLRLGHVSTYGLLGEIAEVVIYDTGTQPLSSGDGDIVIKYLRYKYRKGLDFLKG